MLERELKLNATAAFRLPDLSIGGLEAVAAARRYLDAFYYDTADLRGQVGSDPLRSGSAGSGVCATGLSTADCPVANRAEAGSSDRWSWSV